MWVALYNLACLLCVTSLSVEFALSAEEIVFTLIGVFILSVIVVAANYADREVNDRMRRVVMVILLLINGLVLLIYGVFQLVCALAPESTNADFDPPDVPEAVGALIMSSIVVGAASAVLLQPVREWLTRFFPAYQKQKYALPDSDLLAADEGAYLPLNRLLAEDNRDAVTPKPDGTPLFPQMLNYYTTDSLALPRPLPFSEETLSPPEDVPLTAAKTGIRGFNPRSAVHMTALVFCVYLVGIQFIDFVLGGGLSGVAESFEGGLSALDLLINALPQVLIPLLGVGLGLRRGWRQTQTRLGLERPNLEGLGVAVAVTIGLLIFVVAVVSVWSGLVSEETFEEQTEASDALSENIDTLGMAFLLAALAAIGEEIAFRGALQPVFGFWPTALVFTLTHTQYTLTPASLIIFGVAIAFGWVRQRYNTTTAMLTHFLYNFIPLALSVSVPEDAARILFGLL